MQLFTDDTANSCLRSTYRFIEQVLRELKNLHHDIQPPTVFHFGGDEVPKGTWRKSPACEKIAKILNFTYKSDQTQKKIKRILLNKNIKYYDRNEPSFGGVGTFLFREKQVYTYSKRLFFK